MSLISYLSLDIQAFSLGMEVDFLREREREIKGMKEMRKENEGRIECA